MITRVFLFLLGFVFMVIGFSYMVIYFNLLTFGFTITDYFFYIAKRIECYFSLIGFLLVMGVLSLERRDK